MGVDPLRQQTGQTAGGDDVGHALVKAVAAAEETQTGHAGVDLDVDAELPAQRRRAGGELLRLGKAGHRLGDVVVDERLGILRRGVAQDQQRHGDAGAAQLHGLVQAGHGQIVRALALQQAGHRHGAVAVGVGLDHAQKPAALRQGGADGAVVVADVVKADLGPCSLLQAVSHTFPLLSHCNSFILSLGTERDAMPSGVLLGIGTRLAVDGQFLAV